MQMSFGNFSCNSEFSESRCSDITTLLTVVNEFMFVICAFIKRCELKSLWKVTTRCRSLVNEYPEMDITKATLYFALKKGVCSVCYNFGLILKKFGTSVLWCNAIE
jgi:hypothetical protein